MRTPSPDDQGHAQAGRPPPGFTLRFTPVEWRALLRDASFLRHPDNSYMPRRLMGVPVEIIPDHRAAVW